MIGQDKNYQEIASFGNKRVALIIKSTWAGSTSVVNTALFWESRGYTIDLYVENPHQKKFKIPDFRNKKIYILNKTYLEKWPLNDLFFCFQDFYKRSAGYDWVIAFDYNALIRAGICQMFKKFRLIYHSLEFYEPKPRHFRSWVKKWLERRFAIQSHYVFSQDQVRIDYLSHDLGVDIGKFRIIFNSPSGDVISHKENYFHEKFNINPDVKIVLCVGSLIREHCVIELLDSVEYWPENMVLVMHGWFAEKSVRDHVVQKVNSMPRKIFLSENLFSQEEKYMPYLSSDIGFVGFNSDSENIRLAAGSAGKLFDFLKTGTPIIAYSSPGMKDIVEKNRVGIVFSDYNVLPEYLGNICTDYEYYRKNCLCASGLFDFDVQYAKVLKSI